MFSMNFIIFVDGEFELLKSYFPLLDSNNCGTGQDVDNKIDSSNSIFKNNYENVLNSDDTDTLFVNKRYMKNDYNKNESLEITTCTSFFVHHMQLSNQNFTQDIKVTKTALPDINTVTGNLENTIILNDTTTSDYTGNTSFTLINKLQNAIGKSSSLVDIEYNTTYFSYKVNPKGKIQRLYNNILPKIKFLSSKNGNTNLTNKNQSASEYYANNTNALKISFKKLFSLKLTNNEKYSDKKEDHTTNKLFTTFHFGINHIETEKNYTRASPMRHTKDSNYYEIGKEEIDSQTKPKSKDILSFRATQAPHNVMNYSEFMTFEQLEPSMYDDYTSTRTYIDNYSKLNMIMKTAHQHNISNVSSIKLHFKDVLNFRKPTFNDETTKMKPKIIYTLLKESDIVEKKIKTNFATGKMFLYSTSSSINKCQNKKSTKTNDHYSEYGIPTEYLLSPTTNVIETQIVPTVPINKSDVKYITDTAHVMYNNYQNKSSPNSFMEMFHFKKSKFSSNNISHSTIVNYPAVSKNYYSSQKIIHNIEDTPAMESHIFNTTVQKVKVQSIDMPLERNFHLKDIFNLKKITSNPFTKHYFRGNVTSSEITEEQYGEIYSSRDHTSSFENNAGTHNNNIIGFSETIGNNSLSNNNKFEITPLSSYESKIKPSERSFSEGKPSFGNWLFEMPKLNIMETVGSSDQHFDDVGNIFNWYLTTPEYSNLSNNYPSGTASNNNVQVYPKERKSSNLQPCISTNSLISRNMSTTSTCNTIVNVDANNLTTNDMITNVMFLPISSVRANITEAHRNFYYKIKYGMLPRKLLPENNHNYSLNIETDMITLGSNTTTDDLKNYINRITKPNITSIIDGTTHKVNGSYLLNPKYGNNASSKPNENHIVRLDSNETLSNARSNESSFDFMAYVMKPVDSLLSAIRRTPNNVTKIAYLNSSDIGNVSLPRLLPFSNKSFGVLDFSNTNLSSSEIHESKISLLELFGGWFHCILESFTEPTLHDVHFFLYTRYNRHTPEELFLASDVLLLENDSDVPEPVFENESQTNKIRRHVDEVVPFEYLNPAKTDIQSKWLNVLSETKVLVHGYVQDYQTDIMVNMKDAFLMKGDMNVIVVDWSVIGDNTCYPLVATKALRSVGLMLARLLDHLVEGGLSLALVHMVGFSLGAHVLGHAGTLMRHGMAARITGLDPALPYVPMDPEVSLDAGDAVFVDIIHTAAGYLGQPGPMGHVDFYPNGGSQQPGCDIASLGTCSHRRSALYFIESITSVVGFWATSCDSWHDFHTGLCNQSRQILMGDSCPLNASGKYYLITGQKEPFAQLPEEHVKVKKSLLFDLFYDFEDL